MASLDADKAEVSSVTTLEHRIRPAEPAQNATGRASKDETPGNLLNVRAFQRRSRIRILDLKPAESRHDEAGTVAVAQDQRDLESDAG